MDDLRVVHKITTDGHIKCQLKDLRKGNWFTMCESTGEGIPSNDDMTERYDPDHRFIAASDSCIIGGNWGIEVSGDTL